MLLTATIPLYQVTCLLEQNRLKYFKKSNWKIIEKLIFVWRSHTTEHLSFTATIQASFATQLLYFKKSFSLKENSLLMYTPSRLMVLPFTPSPQPETKVYLRLLSLSLHIQSNHQVLQTLSPKHFKHLFLSFQLNCQSIVAGLHHASTWTIMIIS